MSARSFRSLFMVASCAGAALGCYLVSLRVASERASVEDVETRIVLAQRDLRGLQTEIGTRGRLGQLERWNASAFALSAPAASQFLTDSFELAKLTMPQHTVDFHAPIVLASAPTPSAGQQAIGQAVLDDAGAANLPAPPDLLHEASLKTETREVPVKPVGGIIAQPTSQQSAERPVTAAKPVPDKSADRPGLAAAKKTKPVPAVAAAKTVPKKSVDKLLPIAAKAMTKPIRVAKSDPLAPLADKISTTPRKSAAER